MTKYSNFYSGINWIDLRSQEGVVADRLAKLIESRMEEQMHISYSDLHSGPEIDDEEYVLCHWTNTWKVPKSLEITDVPF